MFVFAFERDNLAFRSELLVKRKHTRFGEVHFNNAIAGAVQALGSFRQTERQRIRTMRATPLGDAEASHLILRSLTEGVIASTAVAKVWEHWLTPPVDHGPPTTWRLLQAFTGVLSDRARRSPNEYAGMTIRLNALLTAGTEAANAA